MVFDHLESKDGNGSDTGKTGGGVCDDLAGGTLVWSDGGDTSTTSSTSRRGAGHGGVGVGSNGWYDLDSGGTSNGG